MKSPWKEQTQNPRKAQNPIPKKKSRKATEKPLEILEYNKEKAGIDISDQMTSYASCLRKGVKWYRKLAFHCLLGMAVVNAWILSRRATNKNC